MNLRDRPAYPIVSYPVIHNGELYRMDTPGMTIRQRYAMAAMQGCVANGWQTPSIISEMAFDIADAMLQHEEREHEAKRQEDKETGASEEKVSDGYE